MSLIAATLAAALVSGAAAQQTNFPAGSAPAVTTPADRVTAADRAAADRKAAAQQAAADRRAKTEPTAWDKTKAMTRKQWNEAKKTWAMEKDKWRDCNAQSKREKLSGPKSWSFIARCMTGS
jgi:hypothetical protein